jgi:4-oxalocrotonate tautomerase
MPIVQIELWEGHTDEQKAKLIDAVTDIFMVLGIEKSHVFIAIHETSKANWCIGGTQASQL